MGNRGRQTFNKRQKEQQRKEKQQEKFARKLQRKIDKDNPDYVAPEDEDDVVEDQDQTSDLDSPAVLNLESPRSEEVHRGDEAQLP